MSDFPPPPVPSDCELQDFPFMPLHVARLRDSDLAAEEDPEACWYAVLLWAASWHQVPAGSLPDNDAVLMRLVGLGRDHRTWKKYKSGALRGFFRASDERLYHPVVVEQVLASWRGKVEQRHRTECARIKKSNQRNDLDQPAPDFATFVSENFPASVPYLSLGTSENVPRETASKGKGERKGEGKGQRDNNNRSFQDSSSGDDTPDEPDFELELEGGEDGETVRPLSVSEIVDGWNELASATGLPKVVKLTGARERQAKARLKEFPDLTSWQAAFRHIRKTPFLLGQNDRGWQADFDFVIQAKSFPKLVEGSYGQKQA